MKDKCVWGSFGQHFLIQGTGVTSSGLLDPAASLGSEVKANGDLHWKSGSLDARGGGWEGQGVWLLIARQWQPNMRNPISAPCKALCQAHLFWTPAAAITLSGRA